MKGRVRWLLGGLLFLTLIGAGAFFTQARGRSPALPETATIRRGTLRITLSAAGKIRPRAQAVLNFATAGTVAEIFVREGEAVRKGQSLARLDATDLELAVRQAEVAYLTQQVVYSQTVQGPKPEELAAARAAVRSAQAALRALEQGPDPTDLEIARLNYEVAKNNLWQAQLSRDKTAGSPTASSVDLELAQARVGQAELQAEVSRLQYEKAQSGPTEQQLKAAEAALAQARANLTRLQVQDPSLDVQLAQYQVQQAEIAVRQLELRLEQARLVAPIDGVVTAVNLVEGSPAPAGTPAITLGDLNHLEVVVNLPEVDVAQVAPGQEAVIIPEATPDTRLKGKVISVAPMGFQIQGVVNFPVTIALEENAPSVRAGMTVQVQIAVARRENALLVPRRALIARGGQTFVTVMRGDQTETVPVRIGMRGDTMAEVLEGLQEGDVVVVPAAQAGASGTRVPGPGFFGPGFFR
ncbi:efflux RND transporter periplasmic adaptor subunit [Thermoflexus hugenholtzii]